ncbi:MAG: hydrogenase maturation nickel metallochaperone HypA [Ignavibacteria bacterium RBG_13_36_8]|nr:MAG: hydrogenase maturation nickel metallochaperone HypA [Ignavibacteria bacterium RBG_13_36_8]
MHEFSIVQNIINACEAEARKHNSNKISKIGLRIGEFTGVVREALDFAFDITKKNTLAENAAFEIEIVPLKTHCNNCGHTFSDIKEYNFYCPDCNDPLEILEGRELEIKYIDIT